MNKNLFIAFVLLSMLSCIVGKNNKMGDSFAANPVVAHRGAFKKNNFPENSIAALREAIRLQCTGSEFDVRMTLDDSLIINHDPHYNKLDIEKTDFNTLTQLKLPNGERLPTLREYLLAGLHDNKKTRLVLEIKPSATKERGRIIAERVVNMVKELKAEAMTVYISFDYDILKRILEIDPKASAQYLNGDKTPGQLKSDGMAGLDYNIAVFRKNPQWIGEAKNNKLILNAWTVNDAETMDWLLDSGFNFITTNEPELALEKAKKRKL